MSLLIPLTRAVSASVIASARFVTGIVVILALSALGRASIRAVNKPWLIVRGVIGATAVFLFFRGIMTLGLGKGTILNYTYPVFAALLAPLILKEKLTWDVLLAALLSFVGIWLVIRPAAGGGAAAFSISGNDLLALLGGLLSAIAVVAIKKLRATDTPFIIYLAQCIFGLLVVGWPTATSSFAFAGIEWVILLGIGLIATIAQLLMTWAYKHVPATEGSLLAFLTPVLNVLLGIMVFGETLHPTTLVGSVLVLLCCAYVAFRDRILRQAA
jgi:drug/metabolite transporter (DMT)-like permease